VQVSSRIDAAIQLEVRPVILDERRQHHGFACALRIDAPCCTTLRTKRIPNDALTIRLTVAEELLSAREEGRLRRAKA
jgi:hypothetical protein